MFKIDIEEFLEIEKNVHKNQIIFPKQEICTVIIGAILRSCFTVCSSV